MPDQRTPARKSQTAPLIRSSVMLRGLATALTLTSLGGMTSFAATHVQNAAAPLQPSASTTTAAVTPTARPAATSAPAALGKTSTTTRRTTTITGVSTTTTAARTKTASS